MDKTPYQPAPRVLEYLHRVCFVAVVGVTGAGKSTLMKAALAREPKLHMVCNNTSRAPRPTDREDGEYRFVTREEMERRIAAREFVQVAPRVLPELYATAPEDYATTGIAMLPVLGVAVPDFRALPFKEVRSVYVVPPNYEAWQERVGRHGFTPEQLRRRLREAESSLVFALEDELTKMVINEGLDTATEDFIVLALGKSLPPRLQADQTRARELVAGMLERLRRSLAGL
jgi:guanylate kinase